MPQISIEKLISSILQGDFRNLIRLKNTLLFSCLPNTFRNTFPSLRTIFGKAEASFAIGKLGMSVKNGVDKKQEQVAEVANVDSAPYLIEVSNLYVR